MRYIHLLLRVFPMWEFVVRFLPKKAILNFKTEFSYVEAATVPMGTSV